MEVFEATTIVSPVFSPPILPTPLESYRFVLWEFGCKESLGYGLSTSAFTREDKEPLETRDFPPERRRCGQYNSVHGVPTSTTSWPSGRLALVLEEL